MTPDTSANRSKWNELYARVDSGNRSPAEIDSVPPTRSWERVGPPMSWVSPSDRRVLDMGCGNGSRLGSLVQLYQINGIGFDVSDQAIQIGQSKIEEYDLADRMTLYRHSLHDRWKLPYDARQFDLIYSIQSMQFSTHSQIEPLMEKVRSFISPAGRFCFLVRSTSRSVPSSYVPVAGEPDTYLSNEPHEEGMVYHHYSEADIRMMVRILSGRIDRLREIKATRPYDPHPDRAWWEVVIRCGT